jgi:6,7-dimethyl-8-ribityllumazine synthase
MSRVLEGRLNAEGFRFAIVASRWNELIVGRLVSGAEDALRRLGARDDDITVIRVPGSFEIPLAARRFAATGKFDAVICVGAVIRGETPHFDYIATEVTRGIAAASEATGLPVSYGIITADTVEQAVNRAGVKSGNKGFEAALSAVEMCNLLREV